MKPGEVFHPNSPDEANAGDKSSLGAKQEQSPRKDNSSTIDAVPEPEVKPESQTQYVEMQSSPQTSPEAPQEQPVASSQGLSWQASESIRYSKGPLWLVGFITLSVLLVGLAFWAFRDFISVSVTALAAIALLVHAYRKPSSITYSLSDSSISVGEQEYGYEEFRSFSVIQDGGLSFISLEPTQRFMMHVNIYFPPEYGDEIVDQLSLHIPYKDKKLDFIEQFLRKLKL